MNTRFEQSDQVSEIARRKVGGSGFADAIFRKQADNATYAKGMFSRTLRKLNLDDKGYEFYASESAFLIIKGKEILLEMTFEEVNDCRARAVNALEEEMERTLAQS